MVASRALARFGLYSELKSPLSSVKATGFVSEQWVYVRQRKSSWLQRVMLILFLLIAYSKLFDNLEKRLPSVLYKLDCVNLI